MNFYGVHCHLRRACFQNSPSTAIKIFGHHRAIRADLSPGFSCACFSLIAPRNAGAGSCHHRGGKPVLVLRPRIEPVLGGRSSRSRFSSVVSVASTKELRGISSEYLELSSMYNTSVDPKTGFFRVCFTEPDESGNQNVLAGSRENLKVAPEKKNPTNTNNDRGSSVSKQDADPHAVPESVLRYERQMRKIRAADRAGGPVTASEHLRVLHADEHVVVVDKPSGVLCVPGVNHNPSLLCVVHEAYGCEFEKKDGMIVHRLDMDTSGVVVFARTKEALKGLHKSFRERTVEKSYEALLCGTLPYGEGRIDLPLQRDHRFPPFMRVSTPQSEREAAMAVNDLQHAGYKKLMRKNPKPSQTEFQVLSRELYEGKHLATRVSLTPITGRTHQLRVHCAAIGYPIVADPCYGIMGEAAANGGFEESAMDNLSPQRASLALQRDIEESVREEGRCMCLHAKKLRLSHPITGKEMLFVAPTPF